MLSQITAMAQGVMLIFSLLFLLFVYASKNKTYIAYVAHIAFLCILMNMGYYLEVMAQSLDAAIVAALVKNCGAFFIATCFLHFAYKFTARPMNRYLLAGLLAWDAVALFLAWAWRNTGLLFTPLGRDETLSHFAMVADYGIVAYLNWAVITVQILECARIALLGYRNGRDKKNKISCLIMFGCCFTPLLGIAFQLLGLFGGFRCMYALITFGIMAFFATVSIQHMFDISQVAHENVFANIQEPIIIVDNNYGFVEANHYAVMAFPVLEKCEQGTPLPDRYLMSYLRTTKDDKMFINNRVYNVRVDRIYDESQPLGYSLLLVDVTDDYHLMNHMEVLKKEAEEANEAKSDFFASMSHELRTPINTMIGMNEMIIRDTSSEKVRRYATDAKSAANMLLGLVNDILDNSKLNSGRLEIVEGAYSMSNMLVELYNMMQVHTATKNLSLVFDIDPGLPRELVGDDMRIRQILINLMTNAVKYTDEGLIRVNITCEPAGPGRVKLDVRVSDSGVGISNDRMDNIFTKFSRIESDRNHHIDGTGLGLNVCVNILQLMGSEMKVESELGVGSTFSFVLEQGLTSDIQRIGSFDALLRDGQLSRSKDADFVAPDASILVVDDNVMNLRVFCGLLEDSQIQVTAVTSGMECLNLVRTHHYDIIFMDHMMPDMDGVETFHRMGELTENECVDTPIIMLTANVLQGSRDEYVSEGFADFLPKPINLEQLRDMLKIYLPKELLIYG